MACLLAAPLMTTVQADEVFIWGLVQSPGPYQWRDDLRLRDLTNAAGVSLQSWPLGAALLRDSAKKEQRKLQAGLIFDLHTARVNAERIQDPSLTALLERQLQQVSGMPITGRIKTEMNPLKQRLRAFNPILQPGDRVVYPPKPSTIRVTGAVNQECVLDFVAAQRPQDYLAACPRHWTANPDYLYLVQPDGTVQTIGIAPWNSQDGWQAEGGSVYVPFQAALFGDSGNAFNDDMAALLATQYIGVGANATDE